MIDYSKQLVSALNAVLPTHYEMALTRGTHTPCISYMELNNYVTTAGDKREYSIITYQVKVWGNDIGVLNDYARQINDVLRPIGFKRISSGELYNNNNTMIQKILTFEAMALEDY